MRILYGVFDKNMKRKTAHNPSRPAPLPHAGEGRSPGQTRRVSPSPIRMGEGVEDEGVWAVSPNPRRHAIVALTLILCALIVDVTTASAHANLVRSEPAANTVLDIAPTR